MNVRSTALIASGDPGWESKCAEHFLGSGIDVHTASRGRTAIDLLHKHTYDYIVVDDSLEDMSVLELSLYVPELATNQPVLMVACPDEALFKNVWNRCHAHIAGTRSRILQALTEYLSKVRNKVDVGRES